MYVCGLRSSLMLGNYIFGVVHVNTDRFTLLIDITLYSVGMSSTGWRLHYQHESYQT